MNINFLFLILIENITFRNVNQNAEIYILKIKNLVFLLKLFSKLALKNNKKPGKTCTSLDEYESNNQKTCSI